MDVPLRLRSTNSLHVAPGRMPYFSYSSLSCPSGNFGGSTMRTENGIASYRNSARSRWDLMQMRRLRTKSYRWQYCLRLSGAKRSCDGGDISAARQQMTLAATFDTAMSVPKTVSGSSGDDE